MQQFSRARLIAVGAAERFEQIALLQFAQVALQINPIFGQMEFAAALLRRVAQDSFRQARRLNFVTCLKRDCTLDGIL